MEDLSQIQIVPLMQEFPSSAAPQDAATSSHRRARPANFDTAPPR